MRIVAALRSAGVLDGLWTAAAAAGGKLQALVLLAVAGAAGGLDATGLVVLVTSTAILAVSILDAGLTPQAMRLYAGREIEGARILARPLGWRAALHLPVGAAMFGLLVALPLDPPQAAWWATGQILYGAAYHAAYSATGIAYGNFRFRRGAVLNAAVRLATVPALLALGAAGAPLYSLVLVLAAGEAVIAVAQVALATKPASASQDRDALRLPRTWRYGVGPIANTLMNKSDTVIVAAALTATSLGVYAIASQAENAVTTLAMIPAGALVVYVARAGNGDTARHSLRTTVRVVALTYVVIATPLFLAPNFFVRLLFQVELTTSVPIRICLIAGVFSVLGGVYMQQLTGLGEEKTIVRIWISAAAVSVVAMLGLAIVFGPVGAAFGALARDVYFFAMGRRSLAHPSLAAVGRE